jgi:hypothetical protein
MTTTWQAMVTRFAVGDLTGWAGIPGTVTPDEVADILHVDRAARGVDLLGDPPRPVEWLSCESATYEGGLRVWVEGGNVVLLDGSDPIDDTGEPLSVPDLGAPDVVLPTVLGRLEIDRGEQVHASLGLAIRCNPDNGILLGLRGFTPTTAEDYRARLRPVLRPRRLLQRQAARAAW